ncbi:DUF3597 domain-containing protein [Ramlibacter albus]|uniref:DUF3597 domain-containing protein n=1 Tax=Ramlibacter albus TaxID=2079448 RepID=A0A923M696_9BURK|nr:DUF3597 domain-containing protein [Ramlibacter albus]MBC5764613.1 DUF3597 domain-containing protein [Ramlibacter albus]
MSILGRIFDKILHRNTQAAQPSAPQAGATQTPSAPQPQAQAQTSPAMGAGAATMQRVDIEKVLDDMAQKNPQKLNWRTSIVDLMKLVGMESSLAERKELADELGYTGDKGDSAAMNIWLHKQVMKKLEENGGKVPASLMD